MYTASFSLSGSTESQVRAKIAADLGTHLGERSSLIWNLLTATKCFTVEAALIGNLTWTSEQLYTSTVFANNLLHCRVFDILTFVDIQGWKLFCFHVASTAHFALWSCVWFSLFPKFWFHLLAQGLLTLVQQAFWKKRKDTQICVVHFHSCSHFSAFSLFHLDATTHPALAPSWCVLLQSSLEINQGQGMRFWPKPKISLISTMLPSNGTEFSFPSHCKLMRKSRTKVCATSAQSVPVTVKSNSMVLDPMFLSSDLTPQLTSRDGRKWRQQ